MNILKPVRDPLILSGRDVTAILGPTNTGKTHLAIERMTSRSSGMIGLPLRLLAREVYQRVGEKVGFANTALITGEEKIAPANARYLVCTVEAMPRDADVAFVAIDEVQLAADLERGHTFTDRLLHMRGREETLLLGSATIAGLLKQLLPGINITTRPRLSTLEWTGPRKISRLPPRSAVVAFSAEEVYSIAEVIRRQRGGAAIVMGALSPRTRNAQVALYQSGDVDYLVATDAIGMGLNLDVDHVAFAQARKFDGYQFRNLSPAEIGQIAGRAGRHLRDGTFGVTGRAEVFEDELWQRVESHDFEPVKMAQWRNAALDFSSVAALQNSLDALPVVPGLTRALPATDQRALEFLLRDPQVSGLCSGRERIELLWESCKLPDYRQIAPAQHADIITALFLDLARKGHVNEEYMADQVRRADRTDGEIDTLSARIAQIRTWTYVSNRPGWLADAAHWREKTREIEDRLSDALHERLTKRFIDRRTSVLMKRLKENAIMEAEIGAGGTVTVEGHEVGSLDGFRFTPAMSGEGPDAKAIRAAAQKALAVEFDKRASKLAISANGDFALSSDGMVRWIGAPVATLAASDDVLRPRAILLADEQLTGPARDAVQARIDRYIGHHVSELLKPLTDLRDDEQLQGISRGIAFRVIENLGVVDRRDIANDVKSLDQDGRAALRRHGVRFGAYHIFVPALIKPAPAALVSLLWALAHDGRDKPGYGEPVNALAQGRTSVITDSSFAREFYRLAGFRLLGSRAVRVDILERLADLIRPATQWNDPKSARPDGAYTQNRFFVTPAMMSILGANATDMEEILKGLGYRAEPVEAAAFAAEIARIDTERAATAASPAEAGADIQDAATEVPAAGDVEASTEPATGPAAVEEAPLAEPVADEPAAEEGAPPADEPVPPVLVWRQQRFDRQRPPRQARGKARDGQQENRPRQGKGKPPRKGNDRHEDRPRQAAPKPRREREPDPDSPFAKLAALKQQMKD